MLKPLLAAAVALCLTRPGLAEEDRASAMGALAYDTSHQISQKRTVSKDR
jgi:hypothetical protein